MKIFNALILLIAMLFSSSSLYAEDFNVDGIYYNITHTSTNPSIVEVTYRGEGVSSYDNEYSGSIVIPETVIYEGEKYSVESIGESAFYHCSGLISVTIPNSVTSIGNKAFFGCSGLTSLTIPNSVTSIGDNASGDDRVTKLLGIMLGKTNDGAFSGCSGLTSIVVDEGNSVYDSRNNCNAIIETSTNTLILGCTTTNIPNSVESIDGSAFSGCSGLTSLTIPNSVTSIGDNAFDGCSGLTSITIPNSVTSIGDKAFWGCAKLKEVYVFADNPVECGNNLKKVSVFTRNSVVCGNLTVFSSETYSNATLYVPEASISSYKSTIPWSSFSRIKANPK